MIYYVFLRLFAGVEADWCALPWFLRFLPGLPTPSSTFRIRDGPATGPGSGGADPETFEVEAAVPDAPAVSADTADGTGRPMPADNSPFNLTMSSFNERPVFRVSTVRSMSSCVDTARRASNTCRV